MRKVLILIYPDAIVTLARSERGDAKDKSVLEN